MKETQVLEGEGGDQEMMNIYARGVKHSFRIKKKKTGMATGKHIHRARRNRRIEFNKRFGVINRSMGVGGKRRSGIKDREMLNVGFINCRRWWSREVDMKVLLELMRLMCWG